MLLMHFEQIFGDFMGGRCVEGGVFGVKGE